MNDPGSSASIAVVRRAGALGGYHRRAQGVLRGAADAEGGTVGRLLQSLQDQPADALTAFIGSGARQVEAQRRVELSISFAQGESTVRNGPDAAPFSLSDAKHLF